MTILGRIIFLQFVEGEKWSVKSNELSERLLTVEPNRGDICSSDGRLLASSVPYFELRMDLLCNGLTNEFFNQNIDSLSINLSKLFNDKSASKYKQEITVARNKGKRFHLLKRKVSYLQLKKVKTFPLCRKTKIDPKIKDSFNVDAALVIIQHNSRLKPFMNLASRTIGHIYEGKTGLKEGRIGLEAAYNAELKGVQGIGLAQKIAGGAWMPIKDGTEVEPKDGNDVITTIDINIQDVAENALRNQLTKYNAKYGTAILMEVATGEIKAISNLKLDTTNNTFSETYNYGVGESVEPGSTFKLASIMAAFEDGYVDLDDTIATGNGVLSLYGTTLKDSHEGGLGNISVQKVFEHSSNVGTAKIILKYYTGNESRFVNRLLKMNLGEKTGIEIDGEGTPVVKSPDATSWSRVSLSRMAIGYEIRLTPLQILTFYNAVANDGKMMKPKFVKALSFHGQIVKTYEPEVINPSICSIETIQKAKKMMEGVVEQGTAMNLKNKVYKIAGKTGTAKVADDKRGYKEHAYRASFCGYFPSESPKYSCIVVISEPMGGVYYGNVVAGSVFKEIADNVYATNINIHPKLNTFASKNVAPISKSGDVGDLFKLYDVFKIKYARPQAKSKWVVVSNIDSTLNVENRFVRDHYVPNVVGMGAKDATFLLENEGLQVAIIGRGTVRRQSIKPNEPIVRGKKIIIELS